MRAFSRLNRRQLTGLALACAATWAAPAMAQDVVKIGYSGPLSGGAAQYGKNALDGMLLKTAETFEQETAQVLDRMLAALVPAITLVLAAVVGVVIIAVLVPLYDLSGAIN